ncbi:MAG: hypothetical protein HQK49_05895 [Oligoflexia bacterium]|nr:hypothetical protein [Oligoflexia bacterium]
MNNNYKHEFRTGRFIVVVLILLFLFMAFRSCSTSRNIQQVHTDQSSPSSSSSYDRGYHGGGGGLLGGLKDIFMGVMIGHIFSNRSNPRPEMDSGRFGGYGGYDRNRNGNFGRENNSLRRGSFGGSRRSGGFKFGK